MQKEKKKIKPRGRGITGYNEQAYNFWRMASWERLVRVRPKVESVKVTNVVGTFLNEDGNGFLVPVNKMESKKVANMVGTFLPDDGNDSRYQPLKRIQKR